LPAALAPLRAPNLLPTLEIVRPPRAAPDRLSLAVACLHKRLALEGAQLLLPPK
jgi:hypothetical protein